MYQSTYHTLETTDEAAPSEGIRLSMGLHSFLNVTPLPPWFPLANMKIGREQDLLSKLSMKRGRSGSAVLDIKTDALTKRKLMEKLVPMKPRNRFRVCVIGGGIAGLSCCSEIFRECDKEKIPIEVVLLEGRDRVGGRICTDASTFISERDQNSFPVDLGASWIHGIDLNPLAALAREAGADFVSQNESVKMLKEDLQEVDKKRDESAGELFDKLLDFAVS